MDSSTSPTGAAVYPEVIAESRPRNSPYSGLMLSTARYLLRTDVHTFAFSVAANSILSFFPFLVLLMTLTRNIFHSWTMSYAIEVFLRDALPARQDFVIHNLNAIVSSRHRAQILSLLILLVTSTGIFMPLEVALNRVWGFRSNRSYLGNQLISLGLAFACGLLALLSIALTAGNMFLLRTLTFGHGELVIEIIGFLAMKIFAIGASIGIFFLIYWLLPNGHVSARTVLPASVMMGLLSEILKYGYILALPHLNFQEVYGPFALSVSMMIWAFLSGLLLLAGAHVSAERQGFTHHTRSVTSDDARETDSR